MSHSGYIHIDVEEITKETDKAFCCVIDGESVWLPKTQIADWRNYEEGDKVVSMSITEWIAREKGIEGE